MKKLKQYIFQRRLKKHLQENSRQQRSVNYKNAKTVLLVFESDYTEKNRFIKQVIEQLASDGKKVFAWGFLNIKMSSTAILPTFKILDRKSLDCLGCPKESFLRELIDEEYDMLIDLTLKEILPLQYVKMYANAAFKAGISYSTDDLLDFVFKIPPQEEPVENPTEEELRKIEYQDLNKSLFQTDQQYLFEQLIFYLKKIETKD